MNKSILTLLLVLGLGGVVEAQITVPNTLVSGTTITASALNTNFTTIANHSLDRLSGGNLAGNITADSGITIDGVDVGIQACVTCTPTHAKLTLSDTSATSLTVGGGLTIGTGGVALVGTTGKIPAISSTYFTSLSGTSLTGVALLASDNTMSGVNTMIGRTDFVQYTETYSQPTISASALTLNLAAASHFIISLNSAITTLAFSNPPGSGRVGSFTVAFVTDGTVRAITWPASVHWASNVAPTMTGTNGKVDIIQCVTYSQGVIWYCLVGGQNF